MRKLDAVRLYVDFLEDLGWTDSVLPQDLNPDNADDLPAIVIQRSGGGPDSDKLSEEVHLYVAVIGRDREHAFEVMAQCVERITNDDDQYYIDDWHIERAEIMTADTEPGDYNPYTMILDTTFKIRVSLRFDD
jgi:hypothetical protein